MYVSFSLLKTLHLTWHALSFNRARLMLLSALAQPFLIGRKRCRGDFVGTALEHFYLHSCMSVDSWWRADVGSTSVTCLCSDFTRLRVKYRSWPAKQNPDGRSFSTTPIVNLYIRFRHAIQGQHPIFSLLYISTGVLVLTQLSCRLCSKKKKADWIKFHTV